MKLPIDKEWFEKRAAAEGDLEIGVGRRKTMTVNLTEDEIAELEKLANPGADAIRAAAYEEAAKIAETGDWYGSFQTSGDERRAKDIAARIRALIPTRQPSLREISDVIELCAKTAEAQAYGDRPILPGEGLIRSVHDGICHVIATEIRALAAETKKLPGPIMEPTPMTVVEPVDFGKKLPVDEANLRETSE